MSNGIGTGKEIAEMVTSSDIQSLRTGIALGVAIFVIRELIKSIPVIIKAVKGDPEASHKEQSREFIKDTNRVVNNIGPPLWEIKNKTDYIHEVLTAKKDGVPLVYNKGLENGIHELNNNIATLTNAVQGCKHFNGGTR